MSTIVTSSVAALCVAVIAVLIAALCLSYFARDRARTYNLWAALLALATAIYAAGVFVQFNTPEGAANALSERVQYTGLVLLVHAEYGLTLSYLELPAKRYHQIATPLHLGALALMWGTSLMFLDEFEHRAFWLLPGPYVEPKLGPAGRVLLVYLGVAAAACCFLWLRYRSRLRGRAPGQGWLFIAGAVFWSALGLHDVLATLGMPTVQFLLVFGFLGFMFCIMALVGRDFGNLSRLAEQQARTLADDKERLRVTLNTIRDAVIATDAGGVVILSNPAANELLGLEVEVGQRLESILRLRDEKTGEPLPLPAQRALACGRTVRSGAQAVILRTDGSQRLVEQAAFPIRDHRSVVSVVTIVRDMTERRQLETEQLRANQLSSIGVLAGGIAHDFNNMLTVIRGNIELARRLAPTGKAAQLLAAAEQGIARASNLTQQLLTFAKGGAPVTRAASLPRLLTEATGFALAGSALDCTLDLPADLWLVDVDSGQMGQVLQNLLINAKQAMADHGTVRISAENVHGPARGVDEEESARWVTITIADDGPGIPDHVLPHIFEPYFSTKETGSGLGLAIAYSVVKRHGGDIRVESEGEGGTTFVIRLPAATTDPVVSDPGGGSDPIAVDGEGKILIMDDDEAVRTLMSDMLELAGYATEQAADGADAVRRFTLAHAAGSPHDLVIMDLTIPGGMGGKEAVSLVKQVDPQVPVLVVSGYSNDPVMADHERYGFDGMVTKPFKADELIASVKRLLS